MATKNIDRNILVVVLSIFLVSTAIINSGNIDALAQEQEQEQEQNDNSGNQKQKDCDKDSKNKQKGS
ncbi:MAG: hypothetical protein ACPKPY_03300 [Nitrososphaeraceae archaeon]